MVSVFDMHGERDGREQRPGGRSLLGEGLGGGSLLGEEPGPGYAGPCGLCPHCHCDEKLGARLEAWSGEMVTLIEMENWTEVAVGGDR